MMLYVYLEVGTAPRELGIRSRRHVFGHVRLVRVPQTVSELSLEMLFSAGNTHLNVALCDISHGMSAI